LAGKTWGVGRWLCKLSVSRSLITGNAIGYLADAISSSISSTAWCRPLRACLTVLCKPLQIHHQFPATAVKVGLIAPAWVW
jgi:hypothetical protein